MSTSTMMIVEDHPMMRTALRIALEEQAGLMVIGEAGSLAECQQKAAALKPDLILLDLYLPDGSGLDVIHFRNEHLPETRILVLTSSNHENDIIAAVEAGANSYVVKDSPPEQLLLAVRSVLAGKAFLTPGATHILLNHVRQENSDLKEDKTSLSDREEDILRILAQGASNAEIALSLHITKSTLRTHFQRMLKKIDLTNHNQLVVYAVKHFTVNNPIQR